MSMKKRLARAIHKSGSKDPESIAEYLLKKGWTDSPAIVTPAVSSYPIVTLPAGLQPAARSMDRPQVVRLK